MNLAYQKIVPRAVKYLDTLKSNQSSETKFLNTYYQKFQKIFDGCLESLDHLESQLVKCDNYAEASEVRTKVGETGEQLGVLSGYLVKDDHFPDLEDFLLK